MADIEERVSLAYLLSFYGPLLTEHRQELLHLYCDEDYSLQEIAETLSVSRQAVFDGLMKARKQLTEYESRLGLAERYRKLNEAANVCKEALMDVKCDAASQPKLDQAMLALDTITKLER